MKQVRWTFTVSGRGHFPLDMLRRDCCWPRTQVDVEGLSWPDFKQIDAQFHEQERRVTLVGVMMPTIARWLSFGWNVADFELQEYRIVATIGGGWACSCRRFRLSTGCEHLRALGLAPAEAVAR